MNMNKILFMLPQVVHVGSNHAFGYKTQHGETYRRNTMCEVHFKVVLFSYTNPLNCVCFVCRRAVPVHLWWCLAQSLTSPTQRQTARVKGEIFSLLGRRGLKTFSQQGSWRPFAHIYMDLKGDACIQMLTISC